MTSQPDRVARPLRRDAEANRRQILEAAGRLMAERGLATPLEDIAAAAGVGIATLYRRFPSRDELVEALFEDRFAAYLSDLPIDDSAWERYLTFVVDGLVSSRAAASEPRRPALTVGDVETLHAARERSPR